MSAPGSVTGLPAWHPPHDVLELAELVLSGAISPASASVALPEEHADAEALVVEDAEGTPVAVLRREQGADVRFEPLKAFSHGPVRSGRRTPAQIRSLLTGTKTQAGAKAEVETGTAGVLAVPVSSMLAAATVDAIVGRAEASGQAVLWLAVFGTGRPSALPPDGLWRAVRDVSEQATAAGVRSIAVPVAVPLRSGIDLAEDATLIEEVANAFGGTEFVEPVDGQALHPSFVRERERAVPPPHRRGLTIFFTGLSGSGKSTLAKALAEELLERSSRTVSLLDGDEVRRMLSAGLGFSRADRDLNIRRIGFVATEVSRHGGIAICAPIAPFARTRAQVRAAVEEVGDFVLIHVSTPLAECERRDRKGLYAKARQGLIPDFTGISSPYEVPVDADLRLDTSKQDVAEGLAALWALLTDRGYLAVPGPDSATGMPEKV